MKSSFPGFFASGTEDITKLWQECLFVLDANVLLSLYRYSDSTRSELLNVFNSLKERLWIPHQVTSEYLENRLSVIADQLKAYDDAAKKVDGIQKSLENLNQAPFVSGVTQQEAVSLFKKLADEFAEKRAVHDRRVYSDDIKDALEVLFAERVGKPFSREEIEVHITEGAARYAESIPPGFEDRKKGGDSQIFSDRCKPYGDYFVWLQLIEKAKAENIPIIFITGDVKDDWWSSFQGKTIGPLPQLIEEFQRKTGKNFYMYTPHRFLERANDHLKQAVSQVAVDEIKNSERHEEGATANQSLKEGWGSEARARYNHAIQFGHIEKAVRWSGAVADIMKERYTLARRQKNLNEEKNQLMSEKSSLLEFQERLVPGVDDQDIMILDEQMGQLDMRISHINKEIEYNRIMYNECTRRLTEVKSDGDGGREVD